MPEKKPKAKKAPSLKKQLDMLAGDASSAVNRFLAQANDVIRNWRKYRDIIKNNYELGIDHLKRGNLKDAILRFRFVLWLEPGHWNAWYYLGRSYLSDNNKKAAQDAFKKALAIKNGNEEIRYLMAIAGGKNTPASELPTHIPQNLLQQHFDALAADYDNEQKLQSYEAHTQLTSTLKTHLVPGRIDHNVLELGVGTGLCGSLMQGVAVQITGVDISQPMLAEALALQDTSGKKIYDALIHREAMEFLQTVPAETYDIVLACGFVNYIGDLQPLMLQVARVLTSGGVFAFTAEMLAQVHGFSFDTQAARFLHSKEYIQGLADISGLKAVSVEEALFYPGLMGLVCVFRK